jgi:DNA-binding transcriptional LysR family regulator
MTPSAVSRSIARLETRLGAPLFERTTRHIELNADGEYFHRRITRILADVEEVERSIIRLATSDHG